MLSRFVIMSSIKTISQLSFDKSTEFVERTGQECQETCQCPKQWTIYILMGTMVGRVRAMIVAQSGHICY
jgi:hypothetical protein